MVLNGIYWFIGGILIKSFFLGKIGPVNKFCDRRSKGIASAFLASWPGSLMEYFLVLIL